MLRLTTRLALIAAILTPAAALAQPAPAPAPPPLAVPNPTYTTLVLELSVNKPAALTWARIGKYCDISRWLGATCVIIAGQEGELGAVRALTGGAVIEPLVAKTALSYTYSQPVRVGLPYNLYHGTLEVQPVTATTSKIVYSFMYDNSMLADDAARAAERAARSARFMGGMEKMKAAAEAP